MTKLPPPPPGAIPAPLPPPSASPLPAPPPRAPKSGLPPPPPPPPGTPTFQPAGPTDRRTMWAWGAAVGGAVALVAVLVLVVFRTGGDDAHPEATTPAARGYSGPADMAIDAADNTWATIETSEGAIDIELFADRAPESVNNFVFLASEDFYNGLTFHHVAEDLLIQGGDPRGDGTGGPGYVTQGELPSSDTGGCAYWPGVVAMAQTGDEPAGSAGSQFFIVVGTGLCNSPLEYALVGYVWGDQGLDVAQAISRLAPATGDGRPTKPVTIERIAIGSHPERSADQVNVKVFNSPGGQAGAGARLTTTLERLGYRTEPSESLGVGSTRVECRTGFHQEADAIADVVGDQTLEYIAITGRSTRAATSSVDADCLVFLGA